MHSLTQLLNDYGYIIIFIALYLELMALPLPGELLMSYCGFLAFQGKLNYLTSILFASVGTICGITTSYLIGKFLDIEIVTKYGKYVHIHSKHIKKATNWFDKYGNKLLIIAFFIPGLRHITGYVSGITNLKYKKFALHAYLGALLWTLTFISLGKALGHNYKLLHTYASKYLVLGVIIIGIIVTIIYLYKKYNINISEFIYKKISSILTLYNSLGKLKLILILVAIGYTYLLVKGFELIHNFMNHKLDLFDKVTTIIIKAIFSKEIIKSIDIFRFISFMYIAIFTIVVLIVWILFKRENKYKNIGFVLITVLGGTVIIELINKTFEFNNLHITIREFIKYSFPSEDIFFTSTLIGTILYFIIKYNKSLIIKNISVFISILICLAMGIFDISLNIQNPSGVIAGYLFATLWEIFNIVVLQLSIKIPKIESMKSI
ncbi:DedA family protein [Paraclostridium tenue]